MNMRTAALSGTALAGPARAAPYERKDAGGAAGDVKEVVRGFMTAFEEYKATNDARLKEVETKGAADPLLADKLAKLDRVFEAGEALSAKMVATAAEAKQAQQDAAEAKERADKLELKLQRPRAGGEERRAEIKAQVNHWARAAIDAYTRGEANLSPEQQKALADVQAEYKALGVTNDTGGGYLAPSEFVAEIIRGVTESSPIRSLVRVRRTANKSMILPKRTGQFSARRTTEQGPRTETAGLAFGNAEVPAPEMYALIDVSEQNLEDSAFDLEAELNFEATEQFSVLEGLEGISGSGVGECEGILTNTSVAETVSGSALAITADGLITLKHGVKTAYARNASWGLNRTSLGSVRKLKDGTGQYLWMPGIANGKPNTIDGDPYVELPDMPSEGAGLYPVVYGDFNRAYTLVDRVMMSLLRDPYTQATNGNIRFLFRRRTGGAVLLAEAIRKLKCST